MRVVSKKNATKAREHALQGGIKTTPKIPEIRQEELTPLVTALVEIIRIQQEQIQELRDEIARLKGQKPSQKPKPKIKPSVLEKHFENKKAKKDFKKRHGSTKREPLNSRLFNKLI